MAPWTQGKEGSISALEIMFRDLRKLWAAKGPWVTRETKKRLKGHREGR